MINNLVAGMFTDPAWRVQFGGAWLTSYAEANDLGPVDTITVASNLIQVGIDKMHPAKSAVLLRWLHDFDNPATDMTVWQRGNSPVRLNLRIPFYGGPLVVHTSYDQNPEADQIDRIYTLIGASDPGALLAQLVTTEPASAETSRTAPTESELDVDTLLAAIFGTHGGPR